MTLLGMFYKDHSGSDAPIELDFLEQQSMEWPDFGISLIPRSREGAGEGDTEG